MSDSPTRDPGVSPASTTEILARLSWTRRLAAGLVGDERADDVAQDAWLAAVRRGDAAWPPTEGWLAGTVRRLAARTWRGVGRRADREARAADHARHAEPAPAADDVVARGEELRRLADLVLAQDEPFRSTLLLRFQEELTTNEIAARLGVPADTVRWRLRTGLERLRADLERRDGPAWHAAIAPLVPSVASLARHAPETVAAATLTGTGGLIMSTKWISIVATAAAVLLGLAIWQVDGPDDAPLPQGLDADVALVAPRADRPATDVPQSSSDLDDDPVDRRVVATAPESDDAPDDAAVISGRVLGPNDEPLRDAHVYIRWPEDLPETRTGADGMFRLVVPDISADRHVLAVSADPFLSLHEIWFRPDLTRETDRPPLASGTLELGDIRLFAAGVVEGRVTDEHGRSIAEPWMLVGKRDGYAYPHAGGSRRGDADGHYRIEHLRPGAWTIEAQDHGHRIIELPLEVRAGEVVRVDHALPDSPTISGVVVDQDGAPIEGVRVSGGYGYMYGQGLKTDADGTFTLQLAVEEAARMKFRHEAYEAAFDPNSLVAPNTHDLVVTMTALPRMRFRVIDEATGSPIEDFGLRVLPNGGPEGDFLRLEYSTHDPRVTRHEGGVLDTYARPAVDAVRIAAPGYGAHEFHVAADPDDAESMTISLSTGVRVRGRVTRDGTPVVGARVALARCAYRAFEEAVVNGSVIVQDISPAMELLRASGGYGIDRVIALDSPPPLVGYSRLFASEPAWATTDGDGSFAFPETRNVGRFRVEVSADDVGGASSLVLPDLELEHGDETDLGDLALPDRTSLSGRIALSEPGRLAGHVVRLADISGTKTVTDESGRFSFERIAPGDHTLEFDPSDDLAVDKTTYFVRLVEGVARDVVLPVENAPTCAVRAVVTVNGAPLAGAELRFRSTSADERPSSHRVGTRTDQDGVIEGVVPRIGACTASLFLDGNDLRPARRFHLDGERADLSLDLQVGSLAIAPPQGRAWPTTGRMSITYTPAAEDAQTTNHFLQIASGTPHDPRGATAADDEGRAILPFVPSGPGTLHVEVTSDDDTWTAEASYHAITGETVVVRL